MHSVSSIFYFFPLKNLSPVFPCPVLHTPKSLEFPPTPPKNPSPYYFPSFLVWYFSPIVGSPPCLLSPPLSPTYPHTRSQLTPNFPILPTPSSPLFPSALFHLPRTKPHPKSVRPKRFVRLMSLGVEMSQSVSVVSIRGWSVCLAVGPPLIFPVFLSSSRFSYLLSINIERTLFIAQCRARNRRRIRRGRRGGRRTFSTSTPPSAASTTNRRWKRASTPGVLPKLPPRTRRLLVMRKWRT